MNPNLASEKGFMMPRATPEREPGGRSGTDSNRTRLVIVIALAVLAASVGNQLVARWIGMPKIGATYRRIGPAAGPQVFLAGSSLLQFGVSWQEVSDTLGQGIENWGVGGSSPVEWEISQRLATNANRMIIGVSVYDLNEHHSADARANIVPLRQTIKDLWNSKAGWQFSKGLLSQYPLALLRELFPTAGRSDATLVGLRRKMREQFKLASAADDRAILGVAKGDPVLQFGEDAQKVSDWDSGRTLRRVALMRSHVQGLHSFDGPKKLAFGRMLDRAQQRGGIIVVVMPVTPVYGSAFVTPEVRRDFDNAMAEAQRAHPQARFVRLDELPALNSNEFYSDLVHLNSAGRRIATVAFLNELKQFASRQ